MCDCEIYEICPQCAPSPEEYKRIAQLRMDALNGVNDDDRGDDNQ